jgi:hypothetical protein
VRLEALVITFFCHEESPCSEKMNPRTFSSRTEPTLDQNPSSTGLVGPNHSRY